MANSSSAGFDSVLREAWATLQDANHKAVAYDFRASEITKWTRLRDFASLGVAPFLLMATTVWQNELLRNILVALSTIGSLSSWLWFILGLSYNWDNQLRLTIELPLKLKEIVSEMRENIEIFTNARSANDRKSAEDAILKLKNLMQRMNSLRQEIQRDQVYASPWMNLMATQDTMRTCNARCSSCNQKWIPGSEIFNSDRAKIFLNKAKKNKLKGVCEFCGQKLPQVDYN